MAIENKYIFDFDSTLIRVEGLEVLAEITLHNHPDRELLLRQIEEITEAGINGTISFTEGLQQRISIINARRDHLPLLIDKLREEITPSIRRNLEFFEENAESVYIVSAGFKEFILPIAQELNISADRVYANTFTYQGEKIVGFDKENPLSQDNGKIECLRQMNLKGTLFMIGDGYSDYVTKKSGLVTKFYAYTENISRENILALADHIVPSLEEFLYINKLSMMVSYPKNRIKVLLLENIHPRAYEVFSQEGYSVELLKTSLDEDELCEKIKDVHILGIRSKTQVTEKVLACANKLKVVGAFCIGTKQIDLDACKERGIVAFNAPYSNTRSVVELAMGEIIMLMRNVFRRSTELHNGTWNKTARGSYEIRGKTLGIIGYGNIGSQLSVIAESMGMRVIFYDIVEKLALGNARKCLNLKELLIDADVVSLHVDDRAENKNLLGKREFSLMKDGVYLVNLSRGFVVNIPVLVENLKNGKVAGAGVDVYPTEPKQNNKSFESELIGLPNVILTPHVGGSTQEAQMDIAEFVPSRIIDYVNNGTTYNAVNFPNIKLPEQENAYRFLHIHQNVPGIMAKVNSILHAHNVNITGQYLTTEGNIGYLITDVDKANYTRDIVDELKAIEETINFRELY